MNRKSMRTYRIQWKKTGRNAAAAMTLTNTDSTTTMTGMNTTMMNRDIIITATITVIATTMMTMMTMTTARTAAATVDTNTIMPTGTITAGTRTTMRKKKEAALPG